MAGSSDSQQALFAAIFKLMRPLVRILLRNGVPYGAFTDIAKRAYVDVALNEFGVSGKKQTKSRISTITGLSRKEIQRVLQIEDTDNRDMVVRYNRAARVVYGWVHDATYHTETGELAELAFESKSENETGGGVSFSSLVKHYSGDVPPRAILDELLQVGVAERVDGMIRLLAPAYIPKTGAAEKLALLGQDVSGLIDTMDRNIHGVDQPRFQRKVFYDNLSDEAAEQTHKMLSQKGQALLQEFDQWMASKDRDVNPDAGGEGRRAIGVGLYFFEEDVDDSSESP
ncbi:MAG: DUF6502 family protein [Gammaproteobacteria bacterium]|nr:DUF6502 family protein [Gammaproteobacteria bacterium]MDH5803378.1 DUF6502 family protein [Gammaproteobacteria bacterium]